MAKKLNNLEARGAFGFVVASLCAVGFAGAIGTLAVCGDLTVARFCLYGLAFGVVGGIAWPDQDSGEAFISAIRGGGNDEE